MAWASVRLILGERDQLELNRVLQCRSDLQQTLFFLQKEEIFYQLLIILSLFNPHAVGIWNLKNATSLAQFL